ncbi:hypothetical protein [Paenarthrobacter sp. 22069]|uniref:hypothetical protein n=1 Tax=Paenarthrobacter sp. 22069 TaxID=3453864 RepID=UPI003F82C1F4
MNAVIHGWRQGRPRVTPTGARPRSDSLASPASSDGSNEAAEVAVTSAATIVVFAAPQTALVEATVFGVFDMPFMADIQFA